MDTYEKNELIRITELLNNLVGYVVGKEEAEYNTKIIKIDFTPEQTEPTAQPTNRQRVVKEFDDGWKIISYKPIDTVNENNGTTKEVKNLQPTTKINSQNVSNNIAKGENEMKHITLRKDGRYQSYKVINGERIYCYGKTQAECNRKRQELVKKPKTKKKPTLATKSLLDFGIWWANNYKLGNVVDTTYANYKYIINTHLRIDTPINKLTVYQLQEIIDKLPATRIRSEVLQIVRQIIKKAYELDLIKKDISQFLNKGKLISIEHRALNLEEQTLLLSSLKNDIFSNRILFYLTTGVRPSEIKTIKKEEIKPNYIKINGTKTKRAVRWIKVSQKISNMINNQPDDFFKFDNKRFREKLQNHCKAIGINYEQLDIYTLRHTFATNLYIIGVAEKDRQTYMGHTSGSTMTNDVYTTFSPDVTAKDIYNIYGENYPIF